MYIYMYGRLIASFDLFNYKYMRAMHTHIHKYGEEEEAARKRLMHSKSLRSDDEDPVFPWSPCDENFFGVAWVEVCSAINISSCEFVSLRATHIPIVIPVTAGGHEHGLRIVVIELTSTPTRAP